MKYTLVLTFAKNNVVVSVLPADQETFGLLTARTILRPLLRIN